MDWLAAFVEMGGYGAFVWPSFAVTLVVLVGLLASSLRFMRSSEQALAALEASRGETRGAEARGETQA